MLYKLLVHKSKYSATEKACLDIKRVVPTLWYYLLRCPVTPCSDHALLQWLHNMKDASALITHWYVAVQPLKFKVVHRPGAQIVAVDYLFHQGWESAAGWRDPHSELGGGGMWW